MNRQPITRQLLSLIFILGVGGCSLLGPQSVPEISTYTLAVEKIQPSNFPRQKMTLFVSTPTAGPGYGTRKMIYTNKPYELGEFARSQWAASPAEMLGPILVQKLRNTGYFHAVLSNSFSTTHQVFLKTHLIELRQDFTQQPSRIKLAVQAELIHTDDHKVVNAKTFVLSVPAPNNTPYAGVIAANRAVDQLSSEIAAFSLRSLRSGYDEPQRAAKIKIHRFKAKGRRAHKSFH